MFIYGGSQDYVNVTEALFYNGIFDGLNVLFVWEHSAIQSLCLNILNVASGTSPPSGYPTFSNRLPVDSGTYEWFGDAFFNYYGTEMGNPLCPGGNYLCPSSDNTSVYYVNLTSEVSPANPAPPAYVGPNSQYYPYWNNYDFEAVYHLSSSALTNYKFGFEITRETALTCYSNCVLHIGLYQPLTTECTTANKYTNEDSCEDPPASWTVKEVH